MTGGTGIEAGVLRQAVLDRRTLIANQMLQYCRAVTAARRAIAEKAHDIIENAAIMIFGQRLMQRLCPLWLSRIACQRSNQHRHSDRNRITGCALITANLIADI